MQYLINNAFSNVDLSIFLVEEVASGAKDEAYKVRKFFVKYANHSFWKCHWIDELQVSKLLL